MTETKNYEDLDTNTGSPVAVGADASLAVVPDIVELDAEMEASRPSALVQTCTVVAPATLAEGYTFPAQVDGIDFIVTVPNGGVREGKPFEVPYPTRNQPVTVPTQTIHITQTLVLTPGAPVLQNQKRDPNPPVIGHWRNGLCDCFETCGSGMFWMGFCCLPVLLGQVMQRRKLSAFGNPTTQDNYKNTCMIVIGIDIFFFILGLIMIGKPAYDYISLIWYVYLAVIFTQARFYYRKLYKIPANSCGCCDGRLEDFCCGMWCGCCTTIQMARHSHDHHQYQYSCCSATGLDRMAPEIV